MKTAVKKKCNTCFHTHHATCEKETKCPKCSSHNTETIVEKKA